MNYYRNDIRHCKGDTFSCALVVEDLGQSIDSIYFTCRENLNDNAEILFQSGLNNGISLVEYDEENDIRKYAIRVEPSKTRNLQSGTYYYDLEIGINTDIFTIMKGKFTLEQDTTREDNPENIIILMIDQINGEIIGSSAEEKLDYLEDTKLLMKSMINDLGGNLTNNDTFRSYVNAIYNIYPKSKGEGTNFTLNNTKNAKMEIEITGSDETANCLIQNKNIFNPLLLSQEENYNTYDEETGLWTTPTTGGYSRSILYNAVGYNSARDITKLIKLESGTYTIKFYDFVNNTGSTNYMDYAFYDSTGAYITNAFLTDTKTITVTNTIYLDIRRYPSSGNLSFSKIQIEKGSSATDFVEYQEQNINLPLSEGEYAYSYNDITNISANDTVKATALMKGDE